MLNDREPQNGDQSHNPPADQADLIARQHAELERLRERVRQLEAQCAEDQWALSVIEKVYAALRPAQTEEMRKRLGEMTPEEEAELVRAIEAGEGLELKDFIGELQLGAEGN